MVYHESPRMERILSPGIKEPLCGWQFFEDHKDDIIPNEIVISTGTATYSIKTNNAETAHKAIREITRT